MILYCSAVFLNNTKTPNFTFLGKNRVFVFQFVDFQRLLRRERGMNLLPNILEIQFLIIMSKP